MDVISQAAKNVSALLNIKLQAPPVLIKSIKKTYYTNEVDTDYPDYKMIDPLSVIKVYDIWQVFLNNDNNLESVFVIISGEAIMHGYRKVKWENIEYEGFYASIEESEKEIDSYLHYK